MRPWRPSKWLICTGKYNNGSQKKSREYALQGLYMYELRKWEDSIDLNRLLEDVTSLSWVDAEISGDIRDFAVLLIRGVL